MAQKCDTARRSPRSGRSSRARRRRGRRRMGFEEGYVVKTMNVKSGDETTNLQHAEGAVEGLVYVC